MFANLFGWEPWLQMHLCLIQESFQIIPEFIIAVAFPAAAITGLLFSSQLKEFELTLTPFACVTTPALEVTRFFVCPK
ncbi:hypothetical protein RINTHM_16760 [Richelia intracellularis HM01]|uniref:hypothetical protein n=1 Tax=Richelia intracellularis TaxID=1164990 RepID=UPI0002B5B759|nr:hypothetical protein RINTHM_16760 [Richelia intracellularis HM01]